MTAPAFRTAERRARPARPPVPRLRAVLMEQIRAAGLALRGTALIVAALVALVTLVAGLQSLSMGVVRNFYEWPTLLPGLMGVLLPVAMWARDERSGQGYPLAGPLDQTTLRTVPWAPGPLIWFVPFTAATASYLLGSALVLGSRRPLRWVIGTVLAYAILSVASDAAGAQLRVGWVADAPGGLLHLLVESRYGLDALLTARTGTLSTTMTLTTGERAMVWRAVPDLADWRIATVLWTGVGLLALWAAASRHREQRRA
jgi:hypothetical protein